MAVIGDLVVRMGTDTKGFRRGIDQAETRLGRFSKKLGLSEAAVMRLGAGLAAAGGAFVAWGVKLAAATETAQTAFTTMLKSSVQAKKLIADIREFAAATPFAQADLIGSAQNLLAFGIAADKVMSDVKMLGDLAAGSGARIQELVRIYGKVQAIGKSSLEQINQMAERGIPIYAALEKQIGLSGDELRKFISAGKVTAEIYTATLKSMVDSGGIFFGSMVKQSATLAGKWSTLKDNVALFAEKLSTSLLPVLKNLSDLLIDIVPLLTPVAESINILAQSFDMLTGKIREAVSELGRYIGLALHPVLKTTGLLSPPEVVQPASAATMAASAAESRKLATDPFARTTEQLKDIHDRLSELTKQRAEKGQAPWLNQEIRRLTVLLQLNREKGRFPNFGGSEFAGTGQIGATMKAGITAATGGGLPQIEKVLTRIIEGRQPRNKLEQVTRDLGETFGSFLSRGIKSAAGAVGTGAAKVGSAAAALAGGKGAGMQTAGRAIDAATAEGFKALRANLSKGPTKIEELAKQSLKEEKQQNSVLDKMLNVLSKGVATISIPAA